MQEWEGPGSGVEAQVIPKGNGHCFPPSFGRGTAPGLLEAWSTGVGSRLRPGKLLHPKAYNRPHLSHLIHEMAGRTESGCEFLKGRLPPVSLQTGPLSTSGSLVSRAHPGPLCDLVQGTLLLYEPQPPSYRMGITIEICGCLRAWVRLPGLESS